MHENKRGAKCYSLLSFQGSHRVEKPAPESMLLTRILLSGCKQWFPIYADTSADPKHVEQGWGTSGLPAVVKYVESEDHQQNYEGTLQHWLIDTFDNSLQKYTLHIILQMLVICTFFMLPVLSTIRGYHYEHHYYEPL